VQVFLQRTQESFVHRFGAAFVFQQLGVKVCSRVARGRNTRFGVASEPKEENYLPVHDAVRISNRTNLKAIPRKFLSRLEKYFLRGETEILHNRWCRLSVLSELTFLNFPDVTDGHKSTPHH
jgi:hypothetical protein